MECPCGTGKELDHCCRPIIDGSQKANGPEQIMRARYTAFSSQNMDFLKKSQSDNIEYEVDYEAMEEWAKDGQWKKLDIIDVWEDEEEGVVEFKAHYEDKEGPQVHHEKSFFENEEDRGWLYTEGEMVVPTIVREGPKLGRNDPCHCGSGKKFKKCHGK